MAESKENSEWLDILCPRCGAKCKHWEGKCFDCRNEDKKDAEC